MSNLVHRPGDPNGGRQPEGPGKKPLPPRYSDELAAAIVKRAMKGAHPKVAAAAEGLSEAEFVGWKRDVELGYAHSRVVEFYAALDRAEAVFQADTVQELAEELAPADKLKLLAQRFPKEWSQQLKIGIDGEVEAILLKLQALKYIEKQMTGPEAWSVVLKLICGG